MFDQTKRVHRKLRTSWLKSLGYVLATGWNAVALTLVPLAVVSDVLWLIGRYGLTEQETDMMARRETPNSEAFCVWTNSVALYSLCYLFGIIYAASFLAVNPYMGPLLHALVEMVKRMVKFFIFFSVLYVAFVFSIKRLYLQYGEYGKQAQDYS